MSKKMNFEAAFQRLEEIANLLESGNATLEESVKLYEEGAKLIKLCAGKLTNAETKIHKLSKTLDGAFTTESL